MNPLDQLRTSFAQAYPESGIPSLCRAPGRINLIGEHIDYNGLPVLPMAIQREIRIAYAPRRDSLIRMQNSDPAFPPASFANAPDIPPSPTGAWENYSKAAIQGLNAHFAQQRLPGMDLYVAGDIPCAAGLSSSSALVVACSLAYLDVLGLRLGEQVQRLELATLLADAEQYVGTRGGGMDQAIILLGREGAACKIDFHPLRIEEAPLLENHAFVACNSLVKAEKTGEALHRYNEGPLTSRLICALVEKQAQIEFGDEVVLPRLGDLWYGPLCLTYDEAAALMERTFPSPTLALEQAAERLATTPQDIRERWLGDLPEPQDGFPLQARARHQLTEFQRVEAARDSLLLGDSRAFGQLMNESHTSCAQDYRVSCKELDTLVHLARDAGALGARMTGAGFGGCTVNLVPRQGLDRFIDSMKSGYYAARCETAATPPEAVLVAAASAGAGYIE